MDVTSDNAFKECRSNQKTFVDLLSTKTVNDIFKEYKHIVKSTRKVNGREITQLHALFGSKVRYSNISCIEETRVLLKNRPKSSNFIHANKIIIHQKETRYICCQAPYEEDFTDFWHLIFDENVGCIIMLCLVTEAGEKKSGQYWPILGEMDVGSYFLRTMETNTIKYYCEVPETIVKSKIEIRKKNTGEIKTVTHYQYCNWVDHGTPKDAETLTKLIKMVQIEEVDEKKVLVHCAAGVGRTGTLVGGLLIYDKFKKNEPIDVQKIIIDMRKSRNKAIQGEQQYLFMYLILLELIAKDGKYDVGEMKQRVLDEHNRHRLRA